MTLIIITGEIDLSVASVVGPEQRAARRAAPGAACRSRSPRCVALARRRGRAARSTASSSPYVGLPSLAVTIGTLALYRGLAVGLLGTKAVTDFPERWTDLAKRPHRRARRIPVVMIPFVVLAVVFAVLLHFTPFGRGVYDIGLNSEAAHFSGVQRRAHQVHRSSCSPAWSRRSPASTTPCASAAPAATTPPASSCR